MMKVINKYTDSFSPYTDSTIDLLESLSQELVFVSGREDRYRYIHDWFSCSSSPCFLLLEENQVIGILATDWNGNQSKELWIELIAVRMNYRGLSHGDNLLSTAIDYIRDNTEYKTISLTVSSNNKAAINLYKKYGFISDNRLSLSYQKMTLTISRG